MYQMDHDAMYLEEIKNLNRKLLLERQARDELVAEVEDMKQRHINELRRKDGEIEKQRAIAHTHAATSRQNRGEVLRVTGENLTLREDKRILQENIEELGRAVKRLIVAVDEGTAPECDQAKYEGRMALMHAGIRL